MDLLVGRMLGPYELQARLGAGGMGLVYRAVHRRLGQPRAVKVLPENLASDPAFVERFDREARLAAELRHPHIVPIYDVGEQDGIHYLVMELLEGRSLRDVVTEDRPIPFGRALHLLRQLGEALDYAHAHGVVHRDVKPANVFVSPDDVLTLVDFGIARAAQESRLTGYGQIVGTAEYMAPEVAAGASSSAGADLYALGVVAYELLTGRVPFTGTNTHAIMMAQVQEPPPSPRAFRPDLPPAAEAAVLHQLRKRPNERFASAKAFLNALGTGLGAAAGDQHGPRTGLEATQVMPPAPEDRPAQLWPTSDTGRRASSPSVTPPPPLPGRDDRSRDRTSSTSARDAGIQRGTGVPRDDGRPGGRHVPGDDRGRGRHHDERPRTPVYLAAAAGIVLGLGVLGSGASLAMSGRNSPVARLVLGPPATATPLPTATPVPTATPTPAPTATPAPPTATPVPAPSLDELTGAWTLTRALENGKPPDSRGSLGQKVTVAKDGDRALVFTTSRSSDQPIRFDAQRADGRRVVGTAASGSERYPATLDVSADRQEMTLTVNMPASRGTPTTDFSLVFHRP